MDSPVSSNVPLAGPLLFQAFISYSHKDKAWAMWLHRRLETFVFPPALRKEYPHLPQRVAPVFKDRDDMQAGGSLSEQIKQALTGSKTLIVLCSPSSAQSEWVDREVQFFGSLEDRRSRVFAAVVEGNPGSTGGAPADCFPPTLRKEHVDALGRLDLTAADFRKEGDGRRLGLLKLIAGLCQVPVDALVRRDNARRLHRMQWLATGGVTLALAFAFLGTALYFQRKEAVKQTGIAVEQRKEAVKQKGIAVEKTHETLRALSRADFEFGTELIDKDQAGQGAAYLSRALRNDPLNRAAAQRLYSLLAHRTHFLPSCPPIECGGAVAGWDYSPDGKRLLVHSVKGGFRFYNTATGTVIGERFQPQGWTFIQDARYLPATAELLIFGALSTSSGQMSYSFQRWDTNLTKAKGVPLQTQKAFRFPRLVVGAGSTLVGIHEDGGNEVWFWNLETGKVAGPSLKVAQRITQAVISPNEKVVIIIDDNRMRHAFNPTTGQPFLPAEAPAEDATYEDFQFWQESAFALVKGKNKEGNRVWRSYDAMTAKTLGFFVDTHYELRSATLMPGAFSMLATDFDDRLQHISLRGPGQHLAEGVPHHGATPPAVRGDGFQLATQFPEGTVILRNLAPNLPKGRLLLPTRGALLAELSPDQRQVLRAEGNVAMLHDTATGAPTGLRIEHPDHVYALWFAPDGHTAASASLDGTVKIYPFDNPSPEVWTLSPMGSLPNIVFDRTGQSLLIATNRNRVALWDRKTRKQVMECPGLGLLQSLGFIDAKTWYVARGKNIEVWELGKTKPTRVMGGPSKLVNLDAAAANSDSTLIAGACTDGGIGFWRLSDGKEMAPRIPLKSRVKDLVFSPDSTSLLVLLENEMRIFDVATAKESAPPIRLRNLRRPAFGKDGQLILATYGNHARLWDWKTARPVTDEIPTSFPASLSQDGRQMLTGLMFICEINTVPPAEPAPEWLGPLAESVFQQHLRDDGVIETTPASDWLKLRPQLESQTQTDFWSRFARWFASDPWQRPVNTESTDSTMSYLQTQLPEVLQIMNDQPSDAQTK